MGFLFGVDCGGCSWDNLLREPADLQGCVCYCIIQKIRGGLFAWKPMYRTVLEKAIYAALIYPRCANITIKETRTQSVARKKINKTNRQLEQEKRKKSCRIRSPLHELLLGTKLPPIPPPSSHPPFIYSLRPIRLYIPQNLILEQPRRKFRIPPSDAFPSRGRYHTHPSVSLPLLRPIV